MFQPLLGVSLAARTPAIAPNKGSEYAENYVLRGQPVKLNDVAGAIEIQNIYDNYAWIQIPGDPIAYAPHLRSSLLPGVPYKRALFQNARGDQRVPNPASSDLIRAANMRDWSSLYRHDLARPVAPELVADPHIFLTDFSSPAAGAIAFAAQQQAARFFGATEHCRLDEPCVPDVNQLVRPLFGKDLFEVPAVLPEDLSFLAP